MPLPLFELLVTLEDGSGSASASFASAAVAELLGLPSPAAMSAALLPQSGDAAKARVGRFQELLRTHVGGLDVEIEAPGRHLRVTRVHADLRDLSAADAAAAAAQRDVDTREAAYKLLERLAKNS